MSLWWRDQLAVLLSPDLVSVRRRARGLRHRTATALTFPVTAAQGDAGWRDAVQTFELAAGNAGWRGLGLEVVLSGHFVRYGVLPWTGNLSADDLRAYAQHELAQLFGADAAGWAVTVGQVSGKQPRLIAAVDQALLDELRAVAARRRLHLASVRPLLDAACAVLPDNTLPAAGWLAVIESGRLSVSRLADGHCVSVRSAAYAGEAARAVLTLLEQEALCAGAAVTDATLFLQSAHTVNCDALRERGLRVLPAGLAEGA